MSRRMVFDRCDSKCEYRQVKQKDVDKYIRESGDSCPHCGSQVLASSGSMQIGPGYARQPVQCLQCKYNWQDCYALVGIKDGHTGSDEYFFAETDADRASQVLIDEIELRLAGRNADIPSDLSQGKVLTHLLRALNRISPEVVQERYLPLLPQIAVEETTG